MIWHEARDFSRVANIRQCSWVTRSCNSLLLFWKCGLLHRSSRWSVGYSTGHQGKFPKNFLGLFQFMGMEVMLFFPAKHVLSSVFSGRIKVMVSPRTSAYQLLIISIYDVLFRTFWCWSKWTEEMLNLILTVFKVLCRTFTFSFIGFILE